MKFLFLVLLVIYLFTVLLDGAASIPVDERSSDDEGLDEIELEDAEDNVSEPIIASHRPRFKYIYIDRNGQIYNDRSAGPEKKFEIAGSPQSSFRSMYAAAFLAINMTKHLSNDVFNRLATFGSAGIFTKQEKLTVFPEYYQFANGNCGSSCSGRCQRTCSFDGKKIQNRNGVGGRRAVAVLENVLCTWRDPYHRKQSIMAHELAHTIHGRALNGWMKNKIKEIYMKARRRKTWNIRSYAMSNEKEYFATAATVYLGVNRNQRFSAGGMNWCNGRYCATEMEARQRLNASDPDIFRILTFIFMGGDPTMESHMTICPDPALLDQYVGGH